MSIPLLVAVLVVTWACSLGQSITRTRRFLVFMVLLSAMAIVAAAATGEIGPVTAAFLGIWAIAWLFPVRLGLGPVSPKEDAFHRSLEPIYREILTVPPRRRAALLAVVLANLDPPTTAWARVHSLLVNHLGSQLDHANEHYLPDRWRVVRARELWDRILVRNVLWARRRQSPAEFDAQLAEALDSVGAGFGDPSMRPPRVILDEIEHLQPPTPAWAHVQEALVRVLREDLVAHEQREVGDPAIRDLQRLWLVARNAG